jgi:diguanylate cyclase (GGDEF)-like protein/PAS domain S-box-containing protein
MKSERPATEILPPQDLSIRAIRKLNPHYRQSVSQEKNLKFIARTADIRLVKRIRPIIAVVGLLLGIATLCSLRFIVPSTRAGRTVRIGINHSPPYAFIRPDGSPSGFTMEVLSEAARRGGIVLQWTVAPEGPDIALKSGKVDVWHLLTDLPDRRKWAYYTDPWLRIKFVLAVPEHGAIESVADASGRRVSHTSNLLRSRLVRQFFPQSNLVPEPLGKELDPVCRGNADAAFMDAKEMVTFLLHRRTGCDSFPLELIPLDGASFQMAIGATRNGLAAAKVLRAEITNMAQDQSLDHLYRKWLRDTTDETRIVNDLTEARQRSRLFRCCAAILAAVVLLLAVLMYRERTVRHAIKSAYEFASAILDTAGGLVFISDRHGRIVRFNRACERATGKTLQEVCNRTSWEILVPAEERQAVQSMFARLAAGVPQAAHEYHWQTRDGARLFSWSNTVLLNKAGRVDYIIATGIDITNREATEQKLGYEATHDALTNLLNRRQFLRELDAAFAIAQSGGVGFTLVLADLDRFKIVNDSHGHEAGDDVLIFLARLLRTDMRTGDVAARLGGDEFCLLFRSGGVESILERIRTRLLDHEFRSATGKTFHAAVTFGVAAWCGSLRSPADFLRAADQALYLAKDSHPGRFSRFESEIAELEAELAGNRPLIEGPVLLRNEDLGP